jgi:hypothetical protein
MFAGKSAADKSSLVRQAVGARLAEVTDIAMNRNGRTRKKAG